MREMKDSGVEWIGEVPREWQLLRFKDKYINKKEIAKERALEYERLALTLNGVIKRPKNDSEGLQPKEFDGYQIIEVNDFVFKMIDLQNISTSRVGLSPYRGLVSPAYIRFSSKNTNQYNQFVYYYLMSLYYNQVFNNLGGNGVRSALNAKDMGEFLVPYPAENEQIRICSCLDKTIIQVDTLIQNVQTQIEKLKAYKQSLITEAVTKGLDSTVPMKDSGVAWIGDVPLNWNLTSIGRMCFVTKLAGFEYTSEMNGNITPIGDVPIVRAQNVKMGKFIEPVDNYISFEISKKLDRCALDKKSLLITFIGAGIGEVAIFDRDRRYHLAPNVAKIVIYDSMKSWIREEYLLYFIMSSSGQEEVNKIKKATAQPSLSMQTIRSIAIVIPPVEEQLLIAAYLDKKCAQIDRLIAIKQAKIEKLEQYKRSLIYEYVTGKKEVV